jgi:hypothetical protein
MLQSVNNFLKKVNPETRIYITGLLLSNDRKNCANMARITGIKNRKFYSYLKNSKKNVNEIKNILLEAANSSKTEGVKRALVLDPTCFIKRYAKSIQNLCTDRDGCTKHKEKCIVPIYITVVDKNLKIPLDVAFWTQRKVIGEKYKSKQEIVQQMILDAKQNNVIYDYVSLDGAFAGPKMFEFFQKSKDCFSIRIPKNRKIELENGEIVMLKNCKDLRLFRNSREVMIKAKIYGGEYFFTAQKRNKIGGGKEVVFIVSNMNLTAKEQVAAYDLRWPQEKINRTTKQKFGSNQCQALKAEKQVAHIMAGFFAHTAIELSQNYKQKKNVDQAVNFIRKNHFDDLISIIDNSDKIPKSKNMHSVAILPQNSFQNIIKKIDLFATMRR